MTLFVIWQILGALALPAMALGAPVAGPGKEELERQKLAQEVEKLEQENEPSDLGDWLVDQAPLLTALVAAGGLIATLWKQASDLAAQRQRDLEQRQLEAQHRLEDRFAEILKELGSEEATAKAGAAASIVTYLEPQHERFHRQVLLAVLTNLKFGHEEPIRKLLARVYVETLRSAKQLDGFARDLANAKLANTNLSGVNFAEADLGFADLRDSNLIGSNLYRARGREVVLEGARLCSDDSATTGLIEVRFKGAKCQGADFSRSLLVNAHLEEADLRGAKFYRAHLQAAHFEGADLTGAKFQQADLADAYFLGAILDPSAKWTISRARRWRKAHFDPDVEEEIQALAET